MRHGTPSEWRAAAREILLTRSVALEMNFVGVTPYTLALAYGAGVHAVLSGKASAEKRAYASRVVNIYESSQRRTS